MYATGFTKNRPFTVSFAEAASIVGLRRGEGASAAVPSGKEGHRAATRKRSTPASQGSAASAAAPKTRKRSKIPEVSRRAPDHLEKRPEEEEYTVAAAVKESIATIMIGGTYSRRNRGRCKTDWSVVTSAGHGSQTATGTTVASATSASDAVANRVVGGRRRRSSVGQGSQRRATEEQRPRKNTLAHSWVPSHARIASRCRVALMQDDDILPWILRRANSLLSSTLLDVLHGRACPSAWKV